MRQLRLVFGMALRDMGYDALQTFCAMLGLAAVLAPLMLLFSIKYGFVSSMTKRLASDPRANLVSLQGSGQFTPEWIAKVRRQPAVGFVIPNTRFFNNEVPMFNPRRPGLAPLVELLPTAEGDPVLRQAGVTPPQPGEVVLTKSLADGLSLQLGDKVVMQATRSIGKRHEREDVPLVVSRVLPAESSSQELAFVNLSLLDDLEDYREGWAVPRRGWPGQAATRPGRVYPRWRMYAKNLQTVPRLEAWLTGQGLKVNSQAWRIKEIQSIDRGLRFIFWLIAAVTLAGYLGSMASNFLAGVNRKRKELGAIRLVGFSSLSVVLFPVIQALVTALAGISLAIGFYFLASWVINDHFSSLLAKGSVICRLEPWHLWVATLGTLGLALLASLGAAYQANRVDPAEVIRNV